MSKIAILQKYVHYVLVKEANEASEGNIFVKTPPGGEELMKRIAVFISDSKEYQHVRNHSILFDTDLGNMHQADNMRITYEDVILSRRHVFDDVLFHFMPDNFIYIFALDKKFVGGLIFNEHANRIVVTFEMANRLLKVCTTGQQFTELLRRFGTKL